MTGIEITWLELNRIIRDNDLQLTKYETFSRSKPPIDILLDELNKLLIRKSEEHTVDIEV